MAYKTVMCPIEVPMGAYCWRQDRPGCKYLTYEFSPSCLIFDKHLKRSVMTSGFLKLAACVQLRLQILPRKRVRKKPKQNQSVRRKIRV